MNTKTVLTGEQINEAWRNNLKGVVMSGDQVRFGRDWKSIFKESKDGNERSNKVTKQGKVLAETCSLQL